MPRKVYYNARQLENMARAVLERYAPETLCAEPVPTPIEKIIEFDYGLYLCYMNLSKDGKTLGKTCFDDGYTRVYNRNKKSMEYVKVNKGTIIIEADLVTGNIGRLRFSQGHELGHWIAHPYLFTGTRKQPALQDEKPDPGKKWIEWHANEIGRNLLLPIETVEPYFYYLKQKCHLDDYSTISEIAKKYLASKQAAALQLYKHKLMEIDKRAFYLE